MSTNKTMAKQSYPEMECSVLTSSDYVNEGINADQRIASYDESFSDSDYDSSENMFDVGAAVQELATQNTASRARMPQTYDSGGNLQVMGTHHVIRRNSLQIVPGFVMAIQTTREPTETK
jgi:hypothetical protein